MWYFVLIAVVNVFFTEYLNIITGQQSAFSIYIILTDGKIDDIGKANEEVGEFHYHAFLTLEKTSVNTYLLEKFRKFNNQLMLIIIITTFRVLRVLELSEKVFNYQYYLNWCSIYFNQI